MSARADSPTDDEPATAGELSTATYVDPKLIERLATNDHQIIYGRRGSGKTHALRVMEKRLAMRQSELVLYADLRRLGDTREQPPQERAAVFLRQLLYLVERRLTLAAEPGFALAQAEPQLRNFRQVLADQDLAVAEVNAAYSQGQSARLSSEAGAKLSPTAASLNAKLATEESLSESEQTDYKYRPVEQIDFTAVATALEGVLKGAKLKRLTLLIDEWSALTIEVHPYLADHLNRVFLAVKGVTVKIAAVEHRSRIGVRVPGRNELLGLETGHDIFEVTILDETAFAYDRDPPFVERRLTELLYRHLTVELAVAAKEGRLPTQPGPEPHKGLLARLFRFGRRRSESPDDPVSVRVVRALERPNWGETFVKELGDEFMRSEFSVDGSDDLLRQIFEPQAFTELARAAQSVPRDFIAMLKEAVFQSAAPRLTVSAIRNEVQKSYGKSVDKLEDLERRLLTRLIRHVTDQGGRCSCPRRR